MHKELGGLLTIGLILFWVFDPVLGSEVGYQDVVNVGIRFSIAFAAIIVACGVGYYFTRDTHN